MIEFEIRVELLSPVLLATDEDRGILLDHDVVFDANGLPYFPARRLKGLLRESALEVVEMLGCCGLSLFYEQDLVELFGEAGADAPAHFGFNNLYLKDYDHWGKWLAWAHQEFPEIVSPDQIITTYTHMRRQTSLDEWGIAQENKLRTLRVLNKGHTFIGKIYCHNPKRRTKLYLALACANLRRVGLGRTRGLGRVKCELLDQGISILPEALAWLKEGKMDESTDL